MKKKLIRSAAFTVILLFSACLLQANSKVLNYAHRGCRGLMPENSILSYKKALEIGADFVDMDINMTKDGVLVVTHDASLNPDFTKDENGNWITSKKLYIKDMTLEEIKKYDIGEVKPNSKHKKLFPHQKTVQGTRIPTLKEVIKYVKENATYPVKFQIEMKTWPFGLGHSTPSNKMADALYKVLKEENLIDITEVQDFDWTALIRLNSHDKKIKTAYLLIPPIGILTENKNGLENDFNLGTEADVEVLRQENYKALGLENSELFLLATAGEEDASFYDILTLSIKALGGYLVEPMVFFTTKNMIETAHKNGLKIVPWDSPGLLNGNKDFSQRTLKRLINYGVDGLITDRPDLLKELLNKPQQTKEIKEIKEI